jgi:hypothetical protein
LGNTAANNNHLPLIHTLHKNNNRHTHTHYTKITIDTLYTKITIDTHFTKITIDTHTHTLHKNNNVVKHKTNCFQVQNLILLYISQ